MSHNGQLDLVLVHPGTRMQVYQSLGSKLAAIEPPVWASLLATFVRKHGFSVQIVDAEAENLTPEETAMRIEEMDPRLAVIVVYGHQPSASTQNMTVSGLICDALKELNPNRKLALVGGEIILADKNHGELLQGGEIEALMKNPLLGRSIPKKTHDDIFSLL